MRRWLTILLLVLLPTQMSWAAVADYCAHEKGAAADHVGHHDHDAHGHAPSLTGDLDADLDNGPSASADCDHCHGQCAGMLVSSFSAPLDRIVASPAPAADARCAAHAAAQPERPQWAHLA